MRNPIKAASKALDGAKESKQQIISTAIVAAACLLCIGIGSFVSGIFRDAGKDATDTMNALRTEIDQMQRNAQLDTAAGTLAGAQSDGESGTKVEWVGNGIDTGRWMTDESAFWDWIQPAFNYNSATEYNAMREEFKNTKGLGDCLFTVQFLAYYDTTAQALKKYPSQVNPDGTPKEDAIQKVDQDFKCTSDKSLFKTWPIGVTADGDYRYLAQVYMGTPGSDDLPTPVMFMFTIVHTTGANGADSMRIADFECWPPSTGR